MAHTRLLTIFSSIVFMIFLSSCNQEEEKDHAFNYIDLEYYEQLTSEDSHINFYLKTIESFPCDNFSLETHITQTTGHTDIMVNGMDIPDNCITTIGPATKLLYIGSTDNVDGDFTLWVNDKQHDFALSVTDKKISVTPGEIFEDHLFFAFDSLNRIPCNTVWGYLVADTVNKDATIWNEVMQAFADAGAEKMSLHDGNYYYFKVIEEEIQFNNIKQEHLTFYFHYDQSIDLLIDIFNRIMEENEQPGFQLRMFNTSGERFVM